MGLARGHEEAHGRGVVLWPGQTAEPRRQLMFARLDRNGGELAALQLSELTPIQRQVHPGRHGHETFAIDNDQPLSGRRDQGSCLGAIGVAGGDPRSISCQVGHDVGGESAGEQPC
ncbi:hypothetical protein D3C87_1723950 [compost metagenome]